MTQEDTCKPRFKGIENFLRRIAFNLGNSPSQTEVKIISCIPIDVTDLQQKILFLEKELSDAKKQKSATKQKNKVDCNRFCSERKAIYGPSTATRPITLSECNNNRSLDFDHTSDRYLSNISFEFSSHSKPIFEAIYDHTVSEQSIKSKWDKRKFITNRCVRNIFKKRKKQTPDRGQTQIVYYAHTEYDPNLRENKPSYTYLTNVFRKHYDPELALHEYPDTSHFSVPICRDLKRNGKKLSPHDSEVCSCCHGRFQNVDIYMKNVISNDAAALKVRKMKRVKNNPSIIDLLPVRENSFENDPKLRTEQGKFKIYCNTNKDDCWSAQEQTIYRHTYNYPTDTNNKLRFPNPKCRHSCREHSSHIKTRNHDTSISNKDTLTRHHKDTKSLQENISSSQIRSAIYDCTKTEAMLNEIKKMLQSVLTEIKTKTEMRHIKEEKIISDAVTQNNKSRDMQRSTFLNSFMYNSSNYCTNPYLMPYAGQIPLTQYCFSNIPFQPVNYPSKVPPQILCPKMTTTRSTNTDNEDSISDKETGKLIKEIFKSLNANYDASNDESCNMSEHRTATVNLKHNTKKDAQIETLLSSQTSYTASNIVNTITYKPDHEMEDNVVHRFTETDDISEEDEDDEYTETISTGDVTSLNVTKKTGVLTKMLSVFKKKKTNNVEETEISDTSDYETVFTAYTDKANNTPKAKRPATGINIRVPASRLNNKRKPQDECRKQWIEDLLNEESRYYAPKNKTQLFKSYPKPVYRQDYETRPVFVVPKYNYMATNRPKYANANKMCKIPTGRDKRSYLKNPKLMRCGRNWKKFILES